MYLQFKAESELINSGKPVYTINEEYLKRLGFKKNEVLSGPNEWIYKYSNPATEGNGLELIFLKEYGILSVEEFWVNHDDAGGYIAHTIVGKFNICSDEDLDFIFSRNIKLNFIFNVVCKRV